MSDRLTIEQRHNNMAAIRGRDTKPEILVRKFLWSRGFRYRLNHPRLPGKPDIVLRKYRTCILVNGCFWHGHEGCKYYVVPKSNTGFWMEKIRRNRERDHEVLHRLAEMGWHTIVIWECELKPAVREKTLESLAFTLNHIYLEDHHIRDMNCRKKCRKWWRSRRRKDGRNKQGFHGFLKAFALTGRKADCAYTQGVTLG